MTEPHLSWRFRHVTFLDRPQAALSNFDNSTTCSKAPYTIGNAAAPKPSCCTPPESRPTILPASWKSIPTPPMPTSGPSSGTGWIPSVSRNAKVYSRYGSNVHKQVYIYGGLDTGPTELNRTFGMTWGIGGWLLFQFLQKIGPDAMKLRQRVVAELKTTFASHYTKVVSLQEALQPSEIAVYARRATGEKYLINPNKS